LNLCEERKTDTGLFYPQRLFFGQPEREVTKMNKKALMGILGLAVSLMFTSGVMAQEKASTAAAATARVQEMKLEKFNGVIKNVDMANKDIAVEYHKDKMSFSVGDKTKVFEGKKELKLSDLTKGLWASVQYNKEGNKFLAQTIHVSPSKKAESMVSSGKTAGKQMMSTEKAPETK
jgi:Cu/Ag efflux protein CusF